MKTKRAAIILAAGKGKRMESDLPKVLHEIGAKPMILYLLDTMAKLNQLNIDFKIIPEKMDMVIGKSSIEKFDEFPLIEMDYAYGKTFNKTTKRIFDIVVSIPLFVLTLPLAFLMYIFSNKNIILNPEMYNFLGKSFSIEAT